MFIAPWFTSGMLLDVESRELRSMTMWTFGV